MRVKSNKLNKNKIDVGEEKLVKRVGGEGKEL
jgi:hypothetical protein